jgi:hypothetical protein
LNASAAGGATPAVPVTPAGSSPHVAKLCPIHVIHEEDKSREGALIATSVLTALFGIGFFALLGVMVHDKKRGTRSGSTASGGRARPASSRAPISLGGALREMGVRRQRIPGTASYTWTGL